MRHTTVADVMSTNVISARPQDAFAHLTTPLRGAAIRAVPVVDDDGTLLGVVSEADLMAAVARPDGYEARRWWRPRHVRRQAPESKAGATTAAELMTTGVETVAPATRVSAAARAMLKHHLSWMPVCDEDRRVVGVLGRSDVLTVFVRDDASIRAEIVDDVLRWILPAHRDRVLVEVDGGVGHAHRRARHPHGRARGRARHRAGRRRGRRRRPPALPHGRAGRRRQRDTDVLSDAGFAP